MRSFTARAPGPELMDAESVTREDFARCLHDLATVNTLTVARPPTLGFLARALQGAPKGTRFTLADIGSGEGDMLRAIARWSARRGYSAELTGVDLNPWSAPAARAATPADMAITYVTADIFAWRPPAPVDFVISSLFTHHLDADRDLVRFLRWMEATATRGWFVNDLHRHALAYYGFQALSGVMPWHRFVKHDGPLSVARSFRRADWQRLLAEAQVGRCDIRWHMPFRLCVSRLK